MWTDTYTDLDETKSCLRSVSLSSFCKNVFPKKSWWGNGRFSRSATSSSLFGLLP